MIPHLREKFNARYSDEHYQGVIRSLEAATGSRIEFRICETPVFLPSELLAEMQQAAGELIGQLRASDYLAASERAIPPAFRTPGEGAHPTFIQVDFAVTRDARGRLSPKLIELQAWASLYAFQLVMSREYQRSYDLSGLSFLPPGTSEDEYLALFRRAVAGDHAPENVVLMEIEPELQKTRPDFILTEKLIGVPTVNISDITKRGRRLFYTKNGREIEIRRIYNRAIIDEFVNKGIRCAFDFREELEVEWAGHPNWFFRWSKFSLPFLKHPTVPRAWFVDQLESYPDNLGDFVLKPLFSFAGSGVKVSVTRADLDTLPENERGNYLLQEKVSYEPVIAVPPEVNELSKVEIRLMFLWPDDAAAPTAVNTLARLSKGAMMGVDFNKGRTGVGSSSCFREC
ncbi:MAG TPA: hypothetical protein VFD58_30720 [Blastocatellia bacterium]|nr:hypothetical protein [Blastocatellia bacterium]